MDTPTTQIAYFGSGDWPTNAQTNKLSWIARLGTLDSVSAACTLHKDASKVSSTLELWAELAGNDRAYSSGRVTKRLGFNPVGERLSGPGSQLARSLELAEFLRPEYQADIERAAERFANAVEGKGGVPALWQHESSGGHAVPGEVFGVELRKRMGRPETVVLEIDEPSRDDEASLWIHRQHLRFLIESDWQGFDLVVLLRNDLGLWNFPSLKAFDDIAAVACVIWLAAKGQGQINLSELLAGLKRDSPVAGIWGVKVPVAEGVLPKPGLFGSNGAQSLDKGAMGLVRHQCFEALKRVKSEASTSLTGLPSIEGKCSYYGLMVPGEALPMADELRKLWAEEGSLTIVSAPRLPAIYAVRLAPVDWTPLAENLGVPLTARAVDGWRKPRIQSYGDMVAHMEGGLRLKQGHLASLWKS